jgi:antitoxin MazE
LRTGWDQAFAAMSAQQDDVLLDEVNPTDWDQAEWEW